MLNDVQNTIFSLTAQRNASAHAKAVFIERLAPDFSPFQFTVLSENVISSILCWLLSPNGNHGQGSTFLRSFLEIIGLQPTRSSVEDSTVFTEYTTPYGRLDIVIKSDSFMVIVENKPWAADQPEQLSRYLCYLDGYRNVETRLIYLTPNGEPPSDYSISNTELAEAVRIRQVHLLSYGTTLIEWIEDCSARCRADRVSVFIDEIARQFRKMFQGMADATDLDQVVDIAIKSKDAIVSSFTLIAAEQAIKERLLILLRHQLTRKVSEAGFELKWDMSNQRYAGFSVVYDKTSECDVRFEFEHRDFRSLSFGVKKRLKQIGNTEAIRESLLKNVGSAEGSIGLDEWWPWWKACSLQESLCPITHDWQSDADAWSKIPDGSLASVIWSATLKILKSVQMQSC